MASSSDVWRNLTSVTATLVGAGIATNFNGVFFKNDAGLLEISANVRVPGDDEEEASPLIDVEQNGHFRDSEYADMSRSRNYTVKFVDGALAQFFCAFRDEKLVRQRITFYQSPLTRQYDTETGYDEWMEVAEDMEQEALALFGHERFEYRDLVSLRLEYAPDQYQSVTHPYTHLHLNSFEGCRIPVKGPLGAATFFRFIVKNFYGRAWPNLCDSLKDQCDVPFDTTIDQEELKHIHLIC